MPAHLRRYARDFRLEDWVDTNCDPIEPYFTTIEHVIERLRIHRDEDDEVPDQPLETMVSVTLEHEGALEDYVVAQDVAGYSLTEEGFMLPFLAAASAIVVRRYHAACKRGEWPLPEGDKS